MFCINYFRFNLSDEDLIEKDPDEYLCKSENKDSYLCTLCNQETNLFVNKYVCKYLRH